MLGFKNFFMEEDGVGVVEMVLIVVVLIGIVVLFKKKLTTLVSDIFNTIKERTGEVIVTGKQIGRAHV